MLLNRIALKNYGPFREAAFDLRTEPDRPIVLFTGNNGAGKTSLLTAFHLGLHGRKSFLSGISEKAYSEYRRARFHNGNLHDPCSIKIDFTYAAGQGTHDVSAARIWTSHGALIKEALHVFVDGMHLGEELGEDFLVRCIPPEIARYFFFDGERIGDLSSWEEDDGAALFASVDELLGLNIAAQLERDLDRVIAKQSSAATVKSLNDAAGLAMSAEEAHQAVNKQAKDSRNRLGHAERNVERARRHFTALGGQLAEARNADERTLADFTAKRESLFEAIRNEAASYMPLLLAPKVFDRINDQISKSERIEFLAVLQRALQEADAPLRSRLRSLVKSDGIPAVMDAVREALLPKPVAVEQATLDISLREAHWMRSVLTRDLPSMRERLARYLDELSQVGVSIATLSTRLDVAPNASDDRIRVALLALEDASQALALARNESARLDENLAKARREQDATQAQLRDVRRDHFRNARLHVRDSLIAGILAAIPEYAQLLRKSKEQKLSALLKSSLETLWHKSKRLSSVDVKFAECTIDLRGPEGSISRSDLSAAEKQLFAISFIFSLANLSDRRLPFAIDTPLARLDRQHRQNLVTTFLPAASHQTILFSTDTEVVGKLLEDASQFIARRYELADYNEGLTEPVLAEASL